MAELRLLALGDSYTVGEGVAPVDAWPAQLVQRLRGHAHACAAPTVLARTGWTTDELLAALATATLAPPYDLVTLQIGVNDQYRGRRADAFAHDFDALLAQALRLAGGCATRVLAVSIPDWGVTPFARQDARAPQTIATAIDQFNARARACALRVGTGWVDITSASRRAGQAPGQLCADGLHPGPAQYARWVATALLPAAREQLPAP
ncbi:SGNH/GDSL hydrolase family protein [Metallibacterium scheffleri]|uniref:SGNH/GDSL hydrolase family protein n=1 Tax=Metallibacterium scheffleri TaxID=993689 RepID=UPI0023F4AC08|nr:GDSL-type esterase/lipase family protein [Metallibacterium scheffleri]